MDHIFTDFMHYEDADYLEFQSIKLQIDAEVHSQQFHNSVTANMNHS